MSSALKAGLLALALIAVPGCASLRPPDLANPIAAAKTPEQKALALIESYAALLEEATDFVANPAVPVGVKRALAAAEQAATPAVHLVRIAFAQLLQAQADLQAAPMQDRAGIERAAAILAVAAVRLDQAVSQARAPVAALQNLLAGKDRQ